MLTLLRLTVLALTGLCGLACLQGCSTVAPSSAGMLQERQRYHAHIGISGRFSVSYQHEGKPQNAQGRFQWFQRGDEIDIDLLSPLGQTLARIRVAPFIAMLERPGQPAQSATNASELTEQMLGWAIPADGLRYWLQGFVSEGTRAQAVSDTDAESFDSGGWRVRYVSWQAEPDGRHPKRIDLWRRSPSTGELGLRLVIDSWEPR